MLDDTLFCAKLDIDLDALVANWQLVARHVAPATASAVVKANGYGLGATQVSAALAAAGCRHFFVAHLVEALAIADTLPKDATLYILNGLLPGQDAACADAGLVPVLNSLEQMARWSALAKARGVTLPAILQVDTGMARMGLSVEELDILIADRTLLDGIALQYIISHLACADEPESSFNAEQVARFEAIAAAFPDTPRALDNSGGSLLPRPGHFDLVRPGIVLYGGAPYNDLPNPGQAVAALTTQIVQLRTLPVGTSVGYGRTFTTHRVTRIATIPVGYADGWPCSLGNRGSAYIGGQRVPFAGRVSMDSITLDVTDIDEALLFPGAEVELLGPHQSIDDVARDAGTISYEILTGLGPRFARRYHGLPDTAKG